MDKSKRLIWIDLEMTGLDPKVDTILEVATIVTDENLVVLSEGPSLAVYQDDSVLDNMNDWCVEHHGRSGLTARCKASKITMADAEAQTINFLSAWVEDGVSPICGNSVGQDRRFLVEYMPQLADYFHYRTIDVSTIKELVRRWYPQVLDHVVKTGTHLAMDDIRESINELKVYREHVFKKGV